MTPRIEPTRIEFLLFLKPHLNSRPIAPVSPNFALPWKAAVRVLVQRLNRRARNLLGDAYAPDHLDVANEKRLRPQGEQSVFQRIKQGSQKFPRLSFFGALDFLSHDNTRRCMLWVPGEQYRLHNHDIIDDSSAIQAAGWSDPHRMSAAG
jgi:hypothetical protein